MMAANTNTAGTTAPSTGETTDYVTVLLGDELFGLPIDRVHDVFIATNLTDVPWRRRRSRACSTCAAGSSRRSACAGASACPTAPATAATWRWAWSMAARPTACSSTRSGR